jgi:hypothetical protein
MLRSRLLPRNRLTSTNICVKLIQLANYKIPLVTRCLINPRPKTVKSRIAPKKKGRLDLSKHLGPCLLFAARIPGLFVRRPLAWRLWVVLLDLSWLRVLDFVLVPNKPKFREDHESRLARDPFVLPNGRLTEENQSGACCILKGFLHEMSKLAVRLLLDIQSLEFQRVHDSMHEGKGLLFPGVVWREPHPMVVFDVIGPGEQNVYRLSPYRKSFIA